MNEQYRIIDGGDCYIVQDYNDGRSMACWHNFKEFKWLWMARIFLFNCRDYERCRAEKEKAKRPYGTVLPY